MSWILIASTIMAAVVLFDVLKPAVYPKYVGSRGIHWFAVRYYGSISITTVIRSHHFNWPYRWTTPRFFAVNQATLPAAHGNHDVQAPISKPKGL